MATGNDKEVAEIMELDTFELLDYVITNPEYLIDPYYGVFGRAIQTRFEQLEKERATQQ